MSEATDKQPRIRFRVNVNRLAKGAFSFDCTCELEVPIDMINGENGAVPSQIDISMWRENALEQSGLLVASLQAKYPLALE